MNIFNKITKIDEEQEMIKIKRNKKKIEKELKEYKEKIDEWHLKYTNLLEEKGVGFDQYLKYQKEYETSIMNIKELKRESADNKSSYNTLKNKVQQYCENVINYFLPAISKCDNKDSLLTAIKTYDYAEITISQKAVITACHKVKLTKEYFKEKDLELYNKIKAEEWNID